jgi:hypothetical protein
MERELWTRLYRLARQLDPGRGHGIFPAAWIVAVFLWAACHDRPTVWACQLSNWPKELQRRLPSQSTMSRRLRSSAVATLLATMIEALRLPDNSWIKIIDAKPLPVGGHSKDPDADWGRGVRNFIKGYKLYAIWANGPLPVAVDVAPARTSEQQMAERLIPTLREGGYLLGDKLYDINRLYDAAGRAGYQLVAQRKRIGRGLGHCSHSPWRLRSIELLKTGFGRALYTYRGRIEQRFAQLTNFASGLAPLPNWVRRLPRVKLWVTAKLLIHAVRYYQLHPDHPIAVA